MSPDFRANCKDIPRFGDTGYLCTPSHRASRGALHLARLSPPSTNLPILLWHRAASLYEIDWAGPAAPGLRSHPTFANCGLACVDFLSRSPSNKWVGNGWHSTRRLLRSNGFRNVPKHPLRDLKKRFSRYDNFKE